MQLVVATVEVDHHVLVAHLAEALADVAGLPADTRGDVAGRGWSVDQDLEYLDVDVAALVEVARNRWYLDVDASVWESLCFQS